MEKIEIDEKSKNIIIEFLKEQEFDFSNFDDFIEYIQFRGMLNKNVKVVDKVIFTKANLKKLYEEYINPIKKTAKILQVNYKQLAEITGYSENGLKNASYRNTFTEQLRITLDLLIENHKLKKQLFQQNENIDNLKNAFNILTQNEKNTE